MAVDLSVVARERGIKYFLISYVDLFGTLRAGCTVVKSGARPTLVISPDGETVSIPVPPVEQIVDTTGAGDAFAAGYLLAMSAGQDIRTCVAAAHLLASRVLRSPGASIGGRS